MNDSQALFAKLATSLPFEEPTWEDLGESDWPQAAVLVALTRELQPQVLLGRRALHLPLHPGEIAFAGGKREADDESPWDTALREAEEEVGLAENVVIPLGEMPPLITRTGFQVFPCVASIPECPDIVVDTREFDSVFFTPLTTFGDPDEFHLEAIVEPDITRKVPHYQLGQDNIWGVTAAILAQLANVAYDAGLDLERDWEMQP